MSSGANVRRMVARYEGDISPIKQKLAELVRLHEAMEKKTLGASRASVKHINDTDKAVERLNKTVGQVGTNHEEIAKKAKVSGEETVRHADKTAAAMSRIRLAYAGIAGVVGTLMASSFVQLADSAKQVDNQLQAIGAGSDAAKKKIYALAIETRTPLDATVGLLRSISKSLPNQELDETIRQVGTLNRLLTIGGLDAGQRGSVVLQFGQALQSGVLSGDELRALRESAPIELMDAIAKRAGGTTEQLRKMGEQGVITRDIMIGALQDLEQVSKDKFGGFQMTVSEATGVFRTALVGVAGDVDKAIGATATMADLIAGTATFLTDYSGAAVVLAESLSMVAQLALVAAGAKGLAGLTPVLVAGGRAALTTGTALVSLSGAMGVTGAAGVVMSRGLASSTGAMIALRTAAGGLMTMMGGPLGVAIFATAATLLIFNKAVVDFDEAIGSARDNIEQFNGTVASVGTIQQEIASDSERLKTVNEEITRAIEDQATAAEAVAVREKAAIEGRIAKNRELLEIQRALARDELARVQINIATARSQLAGQSRTGLQNFAVMGGFGRDAEEERRVIEARREEIVAKSQRGESLNSDEVQWLQNYQDLITLMDQAESKQAEFTDALEGAATAHIAAWRRVQAERTATIQKDREAIQALGQDEAARDKKIADLQRQREQVVRALRDPNMTVEDRGTALNALRAADEELAKLRNVSNRVEEARRKYDELKVSMAGAAGAFDRDGTLRVLMNEINNSLDDVIEAGDDVDSITLSRLEQAIQGATTVAEGLGGELRKIADQSFDKVADNFDRLRGRLSNMGAPYGAEMANASNPNYYQQGYNRNRDTPAGSQNEELVRASIDAAQRLGIAAEDLLSVIMLESKGSPSIRGGAGNRHIGLIQFGEEEQRRYGANQGQTVTEQMEAVVKYMLDRGVRPGMPIENIYAAVNAGRANLTERGDTANGGIVGNIREFTTGPQMQPYRAMARGLLGAYAPEASDQETASQESIRLAETRAQKQKEYLDSIAEGNVRLALEARLVGETEQERSRILRIHEEEQKALEAGLNLDEKRAGQTMTLREEIERRVETEVNLEAQREAAADAARAKEEKHQERMAQLEEERNNKKAFQREIEQDINQLIASSVLRTGDWRDMAGQLLQKLGEALVMQALFNDGPLGGGGGGGLIGGATKIIGSWLGGGFTKSANGNIMTPDGPLPLNRYAKGGIARSAQVSIFGEGRQPEAYVPLPDGRTIPVTIKEPEVPKLGMGMSGGNVGVDISLNNEMLEAKITRTSGPLAANITQRGLDNFSRTEMPTRVRGINSDPKRSG